MSISQIKPRYYSVLTEYNRVLAQKNHLLKNAKGADLETLDIWNARQAKLSSIISNTRKISVRGVMLISLKVCLFISQ
jgi:DNA replication and repair protein RecF